MEQVKYGVFDYSLSKNITITKYTPQHNNAVCVVTNRFLDEEYIEEWCEHYYDLGFDFIYILEDLNGRDLKFIDMSYIKDKVDNKLMAIQQIPHRNQYETYPIFYNEHKKEFNWCGIFDSDEFLILNQHKNIQDFVNDMRFKDADVITVNWRNYGDNDKLYKEPGSVKERFTKLGRNSKGNIIETKIIIKGNLTNTSFFIGHCCIANNNPYRTVFCSGDHYTKMDPFHAVDYSVAALNHYYSKSTEEFIKRKSIGRLDILSRSYYDSLLDFINAYYNMNDRTPEKDKMFEEALNSLK